MRVRIVGAAIQKEPRRHGAAEVPIPFQRKAAENRTSDNDFFPRPLPHQPASDRGTAVLPSRRWRLLGPLEAVNGSLMPGLSAAMLFTVLSRVAEARASWKD